MSGLMQVASPTVVSPLPGSIAGILPHAKLVAMGPVVLQQVDQGAVSSLPAEVLQVLSASEERAVLVARSYHSLRTMQLGRGLQPSDIFSLAMAVERRSFEPGDSIPEAEDRLHFLTKGEVTSFGAAISAGQCFGELDPSLPPPFIMDPQEMKAECEELESKLKKRRRKEAQGASPGEATKHAECLSLTSDQFATLSELIRETLLPHMPRYRELHRKMTALYQTFPQMSYTTALQLAQTMVACPYNAGEKIANKGEVCDTFAYLAATEGVPAFVMLRRQGLAHQPNGGAPAALPKLTGNAALDAAAMEKHPGLTEAPFCLWGDDMVENGKYTASVTAVTDVTLDCIRVELLEKAAAADSAVADVVRQRGYMY